MPDYHRTERIELGTGKRDAAQSRGYPSEVQRYQSKRFQKQNWLNLVSSFEYRIGGSWGRRRMAAVVVVGIGWQHAFFERKHGGRTLSV